MWSVSLILCVLAAAVCGLQLTWDWVGNGGSRHSDGNADAAAATVLSTAASPAAATTERWRTSQIQVSAYYHTDIVSESILCIVCGFSTPGWPTTSTKTENTLRSNVSHNAIWLSMWLQHQQWSFSQLVRLDWKRQKYNNKKTPIWEKYNMFNNMFLISSFSSVKPWSFYWQKTRANP